MNTINTTLLWDANDVARELRISPITVRRWASQGKLRRIKLGGRTLFDPTEVVQFVRQAKEQMPRDAALIATEKGVA